MYGFLVRCEHHDGKEPERKKRNNAASAPTGCISPTRAGLAIFVPEGSDTDETHERDDSGDTFKALQKAGRRFSVPAMINERAFQELRDYADASNDDFVKALCTGIERLLPDGQNPVRLNLLASCFRELLTYQLDSLAPHAAVQQCPWYVQDPTANAATRRQRLRYAISGGLPDAVLDILGVDEPASIAELITLYNEASKYTHVRPHRINHSDDEVGDFVVAGVTALEGLREEIDYLCDDVKEHLRDAVFEHTLQKFLETELNELDILS